MKNKSLFNKISLFISIIIILLILVLSILGSFNRKAYLSDFKLISSKNNIYTYQFRVKYHSKIFRNSDIYEVYINSNQIIKSNRYIRKITMNESGSPFGILESNKKIEGNIDNVIYTLKPKKLILLLSLLFIIIFLLLDSIILDFLQKLSKINFRNRYAYILIIFLCFLIMPNIVYQVFYDKFDHINYENRKFADKPKLDIKKLDNYPKLYETYFNDNTPFRNELVKIKSLIDIIIFNNSTKKDRLIGKNKWLFIKDMNDMYIGMKYTYFNNKELEQAKNNLLHFRDELKKRNIDFILMICNDKQFIYDDYIPDYIRRKTNLTVTDQFVDYIKKETDIQIIYTKDEFLKYKDDYQLYYKYDSHWNYLGGYVAYTQILKKLHNPFIPINEVELKDISFKDKTSDGNTDQYNDLTKAFALSKSKYYNDDMRLIVSGYSFDNYKKINIIDWANFTTISKTNLDNRYLFILRDSYGSAMVPYISSSFNMVTYAHFRNFKITDLKNISPNLFIFEIVERGLKNYVLKTIPNYKIEEINKDLK